MKNNIVDKKPDENNNEKNVKNFINDTNTTKEDEIYPGGILNIPFGPKNNNPQEYRNIFKFQ